MNIKFEFSYEIAHKNGTTTQSQHSMSSLDKLMLLDSNPDHRLVTTCIVYVDTKYYIGKVTHHTRDKYNRKLANKLAVTKAIAILPRNIRIAIWDRYFNRDIISTRMVSRIGDTYNVEPIRHRPIDTPPPIYYSFLIVISLFACMWYAIYIVLKCLFP